MYFRSTNYLSSEESSSTDMKTDCEINSLEHVEVKVSFSFSGQRGKVILVLESPAGTKSHLMTPRPLDSDLSGSQFWTFSSVHFWGEKVHGIWKLTAKSDDIIFNQGK